MGNKSRRSWLIVPASKPREIDDAANARPDVVVLDLVEFVADKDKAAARASIERSIAAAGRGGAEVFVQVDAAGLESDVTAAVRSGVSGIVASRVESAKQIATAASMIDALERERGLPANTVEIVASLETAQGNHAAYDIVTASSRVTAVTLGRADLVMDLRPEPSGEIHLMPYLMQRLVIIAGAADVVPIGAWWRAPDRGLLATPENTRAAAKRGRAIGFKGAMCLRANQVEALNQGYAVRPERSRSSFDSAGATLRTNGMNGEVEGRAT